MEFNKIEVYKYLILKMINPIIASINKSAMSEEEKAFKELYSQIRLRNYEEKELLIHRGVTFRSTYLVFIIFCGLLFDPPIKISENIDKAILDYCTIEDDFVYFSTNSKSSETISEVIDYLSLRDEIRRFYNSMLQLQEKANEEIERYEKREQELIEIL